MASWAVTRGGAVNTARKRVKNRLSTARPVYMHSVHASILGRMARLTSPWWQWVQRNLDALGWTAADLARAVQLEAGDGPDESVIGRWKNRGAEPTIESIRAVARVFHRDFREALIASGKVTADELNAPWARRSDLATVPDDALALEVQARLTRQRPGAAGRQRRRLSSGLDRSNRTTIEPIQGGGTLIDVTGHDETAPSPQDEGNGAEAAASHGYP